eukprot:gene3012-5022_t
MREVPVEKRFLEKRNLISIKRLNQIKKGVLSKSGNLIATLNFTDVIIFDLRLLKPILTIFSTNEETISQFCFLSDEKIGVWVEDYQKKTKRHLTYFMKVIRIETGEILQKVPSIYEEYSEIWKQTFNEDIVFQSDRFYHIKNNKVEKFDFESKIVKMDPSDYSIHNTEILYGEDHYYLVSHKNELLKTFNISYLDSLWDFHRKSLLEFWIVCDYKIYLFSFDSSIPLMEFNCTNITSPIIYGNYMIGCEDGIYLYSLMSNGYTLKLEQISKKADSFQIDQQNGNVFIQYSNGTLLMRFKNELRVDELLSNLTLLNIHFNFI